MQLIDLLMGHSIQEIAKYINSKLSFYDCVSLGVTTCLLLGFSFFIVQIRKVEQKPVLYTSGSTLVTEKTQESRPFGSKNGTTYTFSWCQGASQIKESNKLYYGDTASAERTGRTLSKLCQK